MRNNVECTMRREQAMTTSLSSPKLSTVTDCDSGVVRSNGRNTRKSSLTASSFRSVDKSKISHSNMSTENLKTVSGSTAASLQSRHFLKHLSSWEMLASPKTLRLLTTALEQLLIAHDALKNMGSSPHKEQWDFTRSAYRNAVESAPHIALWASEFWTRKKVHSHLSHSSNEQNILPHWFIMQAALIIVPWTCATRQAKRTAHVEKALRVTIFLIGKQENMLTSLKEHMSAFADVAVNCAVRSYQQSQRRNLRAETSLQSSRSNHSSARDVPCPSFSRSNHSYFSFQDSA